MKRRLAIAAGVLLAIALGAIVAPRGPRKTGLKPAASAGEGPRVAVPARGAAGIYKLHELEAEPRDPEWAPAMEGALLGALAPAIAAVPGTSVETLECRSTACYVVIAVTPELKARLRDDWSREQASFATSRLVKAGPLASFITPVWLNPPGGLWRDALHLWWEASGSPGSIRGPISCVKS